MDIVTYLNGHYLPHDQASLSIDDRAALFSDGVYEVVYIADSQPIEWQRHMERLQRSLDGIKIDYHVSASELWQIAATLLEKNQLSDTALYLQISRGAAPRDHAFPKEKVSPTVLMDLISVPLPSEEARSKGVSAITTPDLRWKRRDLKTISLLPNALAKQEAVEQGAAEAILVEEGRVTEGSSTNIFIINHNNTLQTHPATQAILNGITRMGVIEVAKAQSIPVLEEPFTEEELLTAKEVFLTSTVKHILPIITINHHPIATGTPGPHTQTLAKAYQQMLQKARGHI